MFCGIDLFSDTLTKPCEDMKKAMLNAPLGDEQKGEDPTTKKLEEYCAKLFGKSAAMFFPSATMCNQVAIKLHTEPGHEILGAQNSHIFNCEAGGVAFHSQVQTRMIETEDGLFTKDNIKKYFRYDQTPHAPRTKLVCFENTQNAGGGVVWPLDQLSETIDCAKEFNLKTHLDGARVFNAAIASKVELKTITQKFDTVTLCFSKGLGCPTGAVLGFDQENFSRVRILKQLFGGAMRQSGMLAAAALFALENNVQKLSHDHEKAQTLFEGLKENALIKNIRKRPQSNMLYFLVDEKKYSQEQFMSECEKKGFRFSPSDENYIRAVTHKDISMEQIHSVIKKLQTM